jgi:hypothetical protein
VYYSKLEVRQGYLGLRVHPLDGSDLVIEVSIVVVEEEGRDLILIGFLLEI